VRKYVIAFVLSVATGASLAAYSTRRAAQLDYKLYHIPHGTAYCGKAYRTNCGVHLDHCTDERVYDCLQNVMVEERD